MTADLGLAELAPVALSGPRPGSRPGPRAATRAVQRGPAAGLVAQFAVLGLLGSVAGLHAESWLAGGVYAIVVWVLLARGLRRSGARVFGLANAVTLGRATLVGGVAALTVDGLLGHPRLPLLVALAAVALVLDGVDGKVARRTGTSSALGARFDGEIDAFLILVLSVVVAGRLGPWVLAIGAYRYLFLVAGRVFPWLRGDLSRRFSRSFIAAIQGVVLTVAASGLLSAAVLTAAVAGSLALLTWSFGRDVIALRCVA